MKKVICICMLLLTLVPAFAQSQNLKGAKNDNSIIITGTVKDAETKLPLPYCNVIVLNTSIGTSTDEKGKFKMTVPQNISPAKIMVGYIGYKTDTIEMHSSKNYYTVFLSAMQNGLNEVVITWRNDDEPLKEDPTPIKTVSSKEIEQTTEGNIVDVLAKNVPGMAAVNTGPNVSKPFIHGLGYNRIETTYDNVPVEGQQFEDEEVLPVDMYNIEKAEVVLGPICLMDGPDALGGLVSLFPATPTDSDKIIHGRLFSEYQSNNGLIGNGLRLNYGTGSWSFIARGAYRIAENYSNSVDGRVYNTGFRETNASASVVHKSSNGYSSINFTLYDDEQGIPDGSRDSATRQFTKQIYDAPYDTINSRPVVSKAELNSYSLSPVHQHIQHYRVYSNSHYKFRNNSSIEAMISFQQNIRREYDFPQEPDLAGVSMRLNSWNYDIRYHLPQLANIETAFGINGMVQTNTNVNATDIPIPDYNLFDIGSFFFAKWKYQKWAVSGGIGYNARHVSSSDFYVREDTVHEMVKQVAPPDTAGANLLFPAFKKDFNGVSADVGATLLINAHFSMKANIARGSGAPHVSEFASNGLDASAHAYYIGDKNIVPEYNWQEDVEADMKWKDVDASISLFNNNVEDYIYLIQKTDVNGNPVELIPGNKTYEYQQGAAELYGAESTLNLHPKSMKGFSLMNYFSVVYGLNLASAYKDKGVNGEYLPLIPPMKLFSAAKQEFRMKSKVFTQMSGRVEAEINAAQNRYFALNQTETATPGYALINANINLAIKYSRKSPLQFQIGVNNIFDTVWQSDLSRLKYLEYYSYSPNGHYGIYGMGRNIYGKLILPF